MTQDERIVVPHKVAVTKDTVQKWCDEHESLNEEIEKLKKRRQKLSGWIEAYMKLGEGAADQIPTEGENT